MISVIGADLTPQILRLGEAITWCPVPGDGTQCAHPFQAGLRWTHPATFLKETMDDSQSKDTKVFIASLELAIAMLEDLRGLLTAYVEKMNEDGTVLPKAEELKGL